MGLRSYRVSHDPLGSPLEETLEHLTSLYPRITIDNGHYILKGDTWHAVRIDTLPGTVLTYLIRAGLEGTSASAIAREEGLVSGQVSIAFRSIQARTRSVDKLVLQWNRQRGNASRRRLKDLTVPCDADPWWAYGWPTRKYTTHKTPLFK